MTLSSLMPITRRSSLSARTQAVHTCPNLGLISDLSDEVDCTAARQHSSARVSTGGSITPTDGSVWSEAVLPPVYPGESGPNQHGIRVMLGPRQLFAVLCEYLDMD